MMRKSICFHPLKTFKTRVEKGIAENNFNFALGELATLRHR